MSFPGVIDQAIAGLFSIVHSLILFSALQGAGAQSGYQMPSF
jgi:hypothetical protein|tara:strand:- start:123 stop:248 length:126 start_codon:yes stop_codon:yes gene_type:complete